MSIIKALIFNGVPDLYSARQVEDATNYIELSMFRYFSTFNLSYSCFCTCGVSKTENFHRMNEIISNTLLELYSDTL